MTIASLEGRVASEAFAFIAADTMGSLIGPPESLADWPHFVASWNDLQLDTYLPDGHRYRRRRHATLSARAGESTVMLEPHQPHYQSVDYNPLVGGIERWFDPIDARIVAGPAMQSVLAFCCRLFGVLRPGRTGKSSVISFASKRARTHPVAPRPKVFIGTASTTRWCC